MGYFVFIERLLKEQPITVFGDGTQLRGNTYVGDIVRATLLSSEQFERRAVYNVGGSEEISAIQVIGLLEAIMGRTAKVEYGPARPGEQQRAVADTRLVRQKLAFEPGTSLRDGLAAQVAWQRELLGGG